MSSTGSSTAVSALRHGRATTFVIRGRWGEPPERSEFTERASGLAAGETYEYRLCGYRTSPNPAGSAANPICFDSDRSSDPPHDYDRLTTVGALPPGFSETTVFSGLTYPTAVRFSPDGRVFVAEKSGLIKVFSGLADTTPETYADLRARVHDYWDRGLLGMALDPDFPTDGSIYVLYTHDAAIGGTAPRYNDACADPTGDGCVVSGRLSRLGSDGSEEVLIEDWCQQYPSHSVGSLAFGPDDALYVSGGEGASFDFVDYGQAGSPRNPCGDPPGGVGATLNPPSAEGGALRSQDLRSSADPTTLDGAILRLDPATGAGMAGNPLAGSSDPNARRIIAYGLRNPFRIAFRPGTNELWVGDVGWNAGRGGQPVDRPGGRLSSTTSAGPVTRAREDSPATTASTWRSARASTVSRAQSRRPTSPTTTTCRSIENEACTTGGSSVTGLAFQSDSGGAYPPAYDGALFFADYSRNCIWVMQRGGGTLPNPANVQTFVGGAANPIDLQIGPGGDLFYVDFGGSVRRISHSATTNRSPTARATADPAAGEAPLTVSFDGTGSSDPDGDSLAYEWDLDDDGAFDDSTAARPSWTYTSRGEHVVSLRVTDGAGGADTGSLTIGVGRPAVTISTPAPGVTWAVGDTISFSGSATDNEDEPIPPSDLSWSLVLNHGQCPSCHQHQVQTFNGVAGGSFLAPDHEYPSSLELVLTATDSHGLKATQSVVLMPRTTTLTLRTKPTGLTLGLNSITAPTPFARTVIVSSRNTLSAPSPQTQGGVTWTWVSWSNGRPRTHTVTAPPDARTYTATYRR